MILTIYHLLGSDEMTDDLSDSLYDSQPGTQHNIITEESSCYANLNLKCFTVMYNIILKTLEKHCSCRNFP